MSGVKALNNGFGTFEQKETTTFETYWLDTRNGSKHYHDSRTVQQTNNLCSRLYPSSNPWTPIPGTITSWRNPSAYSRRVVEWEYMSGETRKDLFYPYVEVQRGVANRKEGGPLVGGANLHNVGYPRWEQNSINQVRTQALNSIADGKAEIGTALAEARQTLSMVGESTLQLASSIRAAKRGQWAKIPKILGMRRRDIKNGMYPANKYLEYKFGWLPLMSDIKGLIELLEKQVLPALIVSGRSQVEDSTEQNSTGGGYHVTGTATRQHGCKLYGKVTDDTIRRANMAGVLNPLNIAWELVPFSFVIDWMVPVGNVLAGLTATQGLDFVGGYQYCRATSDTLAYDNVGGTAAEKQFGFTAKSFGYSREPLNAWPNPVLYAKSPFNSARAGTALALLRQLI